MARQAFCRETGLPVDTSTLKTYAEALAQFHLSTEDKFENGDYADAGETRRRHMNVAAIGLTGKEANSVGPSGEVETALPAKSFLLNHFRLKTSERHGMILKFLAAKFTGQVMKSIFAVWSGDSKLLQTSMDLSVDYFQSQLNGYMEARQAQRLFSEIELSFFRT